MSSSSVAFTRIFVAQPDIRRVLPLIAIGRAWEFEIKAEWRWRSCLSWSYLASGYDRTKEWIIVRLHKRLGMIQPQPKPAGAGESSDRGDEAGAGDAGCCVAAAAGWA
jgi:hypothetical protein